MKKIVSKLVLNHRMQLSMFMIIVLVNFIVGYASALSVLISPSVAALIVTALFNASVTLIVIYFIFNKNRIAKHFALYSLVFIYASTLLLYTNYSVYQGPISLGAVASIFETNKQEAVSFIVSIEIPTYSYVLFALIIFSFILIFLLVKSNFNQPRGSRLTVISLFFALFVMLTYREVNIQKSESGVQDKSFLLYSIHKTISRLNFTELPRLVLGYKKYIEEFKKPLTNDWVNVSALNKENNVFVIVIGESVSSNHLSIYGYNRSTTPFLDKVKGAITVNKAIAPAAITRDSLPRSLTLNQYGEPNLNLNLIGLANKAKYKTYWLSNQGRIGEHDTLTSKIANEAHRSIFLNKGDYRLAQHDDKLLEKLDEVLLDNYSKKLIVLHTMGSHMSFSDRTPERYFHGENEIIDFYDSSILFTDTLLMRINKKIEKFSGKLVYFSDHGLKPIETKPYLVHGNSIPLDLDAFHVPLIFIDSSSKNETIRVNKPYFMVDFIHTLADWLKIEAEGLVKSKSIINENFDKKESSNYIYHPITGENVNAFSLFDFDE